MVNKDYILRMAEMFGREISILLRLRQRDKYEEELVAIDDLLFKKVGMTSSFINSLSEEMLLQALSPLGALNVEACLWIAGLIKEEGEVYEAKGNETESYYRNVKALYLFLEAINREHVPDELEFHQYIRELQEKLQEYELPLNLKRKIFRFCEQKGFYDQAENILFEMLETAEDKEELRAQGREFYRRLKLKSDEDLLAGNLSREEIEESLEQIEER